MMYGAVFGRRYSREDYGAVMNYARVMPPAVKGGVAYEDAKIEFKFTLFSAEKAEQMKEDIHGRWLEIVLEREPEFFYQGRVSCNKVEQDGRVYEAYLQV